MITYLLIATINFATIYSVSKELLSVRIRLATTSSNWDKLVQGLKLRFRTPKVTSSKISISVYCNIPIRLGQDIHTDMLRTYRCIDDNLTVTTFTHKKHKTTALALGLGLLDTLGKP